MNLLKPLLVIIAASLMAAVSAWVIAVKLLPLTNAGPIDQVSSNQLNEPSPTPAPLKLEPAKLYSLINAHRKDHDLSPLRVHPALEKSAAAKNADMVANQYWRHQDRELLESWYLVKQAGYNYQKVGENLAFAGQSEWQIFSDWVSSPTHNAQLLEPTYEDMGLAFDCQSYARTAGGGCLVTLHLGKTSIN